MVRRRGAVLAAVVAAATVAMPSPGGAVVRSAPPGVTARSACPTALPAQMSSVRGARQLVTVVAADPASTVAVVTGWERDDGCWTAAIGPVIGRVGIHGIRLHKREGDGATPRGIFGIYSTIYGNAADPGVHLRYRRLRCGDWWDEDVHSATYNTFQQVPCDSTPRFANGASEPLWRSPRAYASFAVIGYNTARVPGLGSAIFLHVSLGQPTEVCVAIARPLLDRVLDWLRPRTGARIAIATTSTILGL